MLTLNGRYLDEEEQAEALSHLQRLASIGTVTASVAHELINPLSIITTTVNNLQKLLSQDDVSGEELEHYLKIIDRSAWRCVRLAETVRTYSHQGEIQLGPASLEGIVQEALVLLRYQFEQADRLQLKVDVAENMPAICCDQVQILQVVVNLLLNARDVLPQNGARIEVKLWSDEELDSQMISVSDNGKGIKPELQARIFEPYFTTKSAGEGTGLGLAIAAEIVANHNGRIGVENNQEGGATFTLTLPTHQP